MTIYIFFSFFLHRIEFALSEDFQNFLKLDFSNDKLLGQLTHLSNQQFDQYFVSRDNVVIKRDTQSQQDSFSSSIRGRSMINSTMNRSRQLMNSMSSTMTDVKGGSSSYVYGGDSDNITPEYVIVTYIRNPQQIFLHSMSHEWDLNQIQDRCNREGLTASVPDNVLIKKRYLVKRQTDNTFYRCVTMSREKNFLWKCVYIDYGWVEKLPQTSLRIISYQLQEARTRLKKCQIYNIKPKSNTDIWDQNATRILNILIGTKKASMFIVLTDNFTHMDLIVSYNAQQISVRDALLFTGYAEEATTIMEHFSLKSIEKLLSVKKKLESGTSWKRIAPNIQPGGNIFKVKVMHIVSPQEFYCCKASHNTILETSKTELNKFYQEYDNSNNFIYVPLVNMVCAVKFNDLWYRGVIRELQSNGHCLVFFVDYGYSEPINWRNLQFLDDKFLHVAEGVFCCSIMDVVPLQGNNYEWSCHAIEEFKEITTNNSLQIIIENFNKNSKIHDVTLYAMNNKESEKNLCLNEFLVDSNYGQYAGAVDYSKTLTDNTHKNRAAVKDTASITDDLKDILIPEKVIATKRPSQLSQSSKIKRSKVKVTSVFSPSEFYVTLLKHEEVMSQTHNAIQNIIRLNGIQEPDTPWMVNDICFILTKLSNMSTVSAEWYRGRIIEIIPDTEYKIFLCDIGIKISVNESKIKSHLSKMNEDYSRIHDGAIRCHLACLVPTGGLTKWPLGSIEYFAEIIESRPRDEFWATLYRETVPTCPNSMSIILWTITLDDNIDPLAPSVTNWTNINEMLAYSGRLHLTEKFNIVTNVPKSIDMEIQSENLKIFLNELNSKTLIDSSVIDCGETTTNNDNELGGGGVLCDLNQLRLAEKLEMVEETMTRINKWIPAIPIDRTLFTAKPTFISNNGTIFLHATDQEMKLDEMNDILNKTYEKTQPRRETEWRQGQPCIARYHLDNRFYRAVFKTKNGNTAKVQFIDFGNEEECYLQDLREKVLFASIPIMASQYYLVYISPKEKKRWEVSTIEFIHSLIVGKLCTIRVPQNVVPGQLMACNIDVDSSDIGNLLIQHNLARYDPNQNVNKFRMGIQSSSTTMNSTRDIVILSDTSDNDDHDEKMDTLNGDDINITNNTNINETFAITSDISFRVNEFDTSSVKSAKYRKRFPHIPLDISCPGFYCDITQMMATLSFYVYPNIDEHHQMFTHLMTEIQTCPKKFFPSFTQVKIGIFCLAKYTADNIWYRGMVKSIDVKREIIEIRYIDFLNEEKVPFGNIRVFPKNFFDYPLRCLRVQVCGVKVANFLRDTDVQREFGKLLEGRKIYAKIISDDIIPQVEFYTNDKCKELVYETLFDRKFFVRS